MRRLIAVTLLAGCASTVTYEDPCACIIIPDLNGALSVAMGSSALMLDDGETTPITGTLYLVGNAYATANGIDIDGFSGVSMEATWGDSATWDITSPATLTDLHFQTDTRADTEWDANVTYLLGPQGGTLRVREIVPGAEGDYRLRGSYAAQVCVEVTNDGCTMLTGNFAFDISELPPTGNAAALVPAG